MRRLSLAVLLVLFVAMLYFAPRRGFAENKPSHPATPKKTKVERPPFDLTYVPPDATGIIAVRPNVIFSDPAMKPLAQMANEALTQLLQSCQISLDSKLSIDEIEQVIGYITIAPGGKEKGRNHTLGVGLTMIRTKHDFDWVKLLRQLDPKTEEIRWKGLAYYKCRPRWLSKLSAKAHIDCFIPDKRTLVLPGPGALKDGQAGEANRQPPHFSWDKDWKRVEHSLIAVTLDNRWARGLSKEQIGGEPWAKALTQHASTMVAGVDWVDGIDFRVFLSCKDDTAAKQAVRGARDLLGMMRLTTEALPSDVEESERQAAVFQMQVWKSLLERAQVTRLGPTVCIHSGAKISVADVVKVLTFGVTRSPK